MTAPAWDCPGRLWSLLEMLRFHAVPFSVAFGNLERAEGTIALGGLHAYGPEGPSRPEYVAEIQRHMDELSTECDALPLSLSLREQIKRVQGRVSMNNDTERHVLMVLIQEIKQNLVHELVSHWFLLIPSNRRYLFEQKKPLFGDPVAEKFGEANRDIASVGRCLALDEWTAAVFHLMRVLEHGLFWLVGQLRLNDVEAARLENWKNIIDQVEADVRKLEGQAKSAQKSEDLKFYSEAASQFRWFKDAWRNHVAHGRATYDEADAMSIFAHVRDFMGVLATRA